MDEEKFSLERFLELMGERGDLDRSEGPNSDRFREAKSRVEGKLFHVEQSVRTDIRERRTVEKPEDDGRAEAAERDKPKTEKPRDDRRDVLRARAIARVEPPKEVAAEPRRAGLIGRAVETVRRAFGWETGEVAERGENAERAGDAVFESAEQVGARVEREWHEDEMPRARERVWREEEVESTKRARQWAEDVAEAQEQRGARSTHSAAGLREIAENDSNSAESWGKIAESRKSDVGVGVDLRTISRAIERDARRY